MRVSARMLERMHSVPAIDPVNTASLRNRFSLFFFFFLKFA